MRMNLKFGSHVFLILICSFFVISIQFLSGAEETKIGDRPYELEWANRTEDAVKPLIDFESDAPWKVETKNGIATFTRSQEERIWGSYVGKFTWRATDPGAVYTARPSQPFAVPKNSFDAMTCWLYGNNWSHYLPVDPKNPAVTIEVLFTAPGEKERSFFLTEVKWKEWHLLHYHFSAKEQEYLHRPGVRFTGFRLIGGTNRVDSTLYFDNFALFKEEFNPLTFAKRPKRGIDMFPGQPTGTNTGEGRLPFPTREDTILPTTLDANATNTLEEKNGVFRWRYRGTDGELDFEYTPRLGTLSDMKARWKGSEPFLPAENGGVTELVTADGKLEPIKVRKLLSIRRSGNKVIARWAVQSEHVQTRIEYHFQMKGKNLIWDTFSRGGKVSKIELGRLSGVVKPRAFKIPYLVYVYYDRPFALLFDVKGSKEPLFLLSQFDWYRSNASSVYGALGKTCDETSGFSGGGVTYLAKTDGKRNDVYERFFISISPQFEEILPNIPNPQSPWKSVAGSHVWCPWGAHADRKLDYDFWRNIKRIGLDNVLVTDHEYTWRDGGESFTFRTRPAPKKGGEKGLYDYTRFMRDEMGFVYGTYNNYTDLAPVNEYWSFDMVSRTSGNQLQKAWARCYGPKPVYAVEYCEKIIPQIQKKYNFNTVYCDVHTSTPPWVRTDYDPRVPGAGTFAGVFYAYGELFLLQKNTWQGPIYSEGPHHFLYSGLTDGNYPQDFSYNIPENPWLVDFDLLKIHDLECNFGMGSLSSFFRDIQNNPLSTLPQRRHGLDQFFAATLAFGHPGFLVTFGPYDMTAPMKSYHMIQPIAARYTMSSVESIEYQNEQGKRCGTSEAIYRDVIGRKHIVIRYKDGTFLAINGNATEPMTVELQEPVSMPNGKKSKEIVLPPFGYFGITADQTIMTCSITQDQDRYDLAISPEVIYFDGRGQLLLTEKAAGKEGVSCRKLKEGKYEIVNLKNEPCGFQIRADKAIAFDKDDKELGPVNIKYGRGLLFIEPVKNGYRYLLEESTAPASDDVYLSDDWFVASGQKVEIYLRNHPDQKKEIKIPPEAKAGSLYWLEPEPGKWIPFAVTLFCDNEFLLKDNRYLHVTTQYNILRPKAPVRFVFSRDGEKIVPASSEEVGQEPRPVFHTVFDLGIPKSIGEEKISLTTAAGACGRTSPQTFKIKEDYFDWNYDLMYEPNTGAKITDREILPAIKGFQFRKGKENTDITAFATSGTQVTRRDVLSCGDVNRRGWFIHPPCRNGVGRAWVEFEIPLRKVDDYKPWLKAMVGKMDRSGDGDGILFKISVIEQGKEIVLAEQLVKERKWFPLQADLSPWLGKTVRVRLSTDPGPKDNVASDWACWSDIYVQTKEKCLIRSFPGR